MSAFVELYIDQGSSFTNVINLTDDITNAAINTSGYTVTSQLRRSYYSANATANITCSITNSSNGEITMTLTAGETANIKSGRYVFDVKVNDNANTISRVLEGIITVLPQVSK
jgi:uncharacterized protein YbcV (DUF1398 family)